MQARLLALSLGILAAACSSSSDLTSSLAADDAASTNNDGAQAMDAGADRSLGEVGVGTVDAGISGESAVGDGSDEGASQTTAPSAADLLAKVANCGGAAIKGGFGLDGQGSISMYQCPGVVYWKADLDVDCDGIQSPPCNTDPQGQSQTSIGGGDPSTEVDPTLLPYFVIPLGKPETAWYTSYGVELGQVGAVIYQGHVQYGIFADEAGGWFIGEGSYAMCQLFLGPPSGGSDPCDPSTGGIDAADVTFITFTGVSNQAMGNDVYDHGKHAEMGASAARAWLLQR